MVQLDLYGKIIEFDDSKKYYSIRFNLNDKFTFISPKYSVTASSLRYTARQFNKDNFNKIIKKELLNIEKILKGGSFKVSNRIIKAIDDDDIDHTERYRNAYELFSRILKELG